MKQMGDEDINGQFQELQNVLGKTSNNEMHAVEEKREIKGNIRPFPDIPDAFMEYIAADRNIPCLLLNSTPGASGYINAVYIDKPNVGFYYPADNHILKEGMFQVSCSRSVPHFGFNAWDNTSDVPKSSKDFLDFIRSVDATLRETSTRGPEQFEFCHECVLSYVKSFEYSQYANFTTSIASEPDA
ncbi:hypothetical protein MAR_031586 [Mya arenaria]|uniref:Uncharacterized protein n=1 Tax=Mya arenaria TaxID=6604 RepID=A0ABY7F7J3_MYAAR|nr:hypothetical protein MAR_031586 [Mya arenaria]